MDIKLSLDTSTVQKALKLTDKQLQRLQKRAVKRTAINARAISSKGNLGVDGLRRKKVPRARVKPLKGETPGVWFGLNDIRASEFKEKPVQEKKGVRFQGKFYPGYFLTRFRYDPNPASIKRAVTLPEGKKSWEEILIPIEAQARGFIEREIEGKIGDLYNKNFEQAIDSVRYVKKK